MKNRFDIKRLGNIPLLKQSFFLIGLCAIAPFQMLFKQAPIPVMIILVVMIASGFFLEKGILKLVKHYPKQNIIKELLTVGQQPLKWGVELTLLFLLQYYFQLDTDILEVLFVADNAIEMILFATALNGFIVKWTLYTLNWVKLR